MPVLNGKAYWASVVTPNTTFDEDGVYSIDLAVDEENKKSAVAEGLSIKNKGDERGDFVTIKRKAKRKDGIEINSIVADPLFEDIANQNFELKAGSPAFKLGFKKIDMSQIGLKKNIFPKRYIKFDVEDIDGRRPNFHRNRKGEETYDFW